MPTANFVPDCDLLNPLARICARRRRLLRRAQQRQFRQAALHELLRSGHSRGLGRPSQRLADRRVHSTGADAARLGGGRLFLAVAHAFQRHQRFVSDNLLTTAASYDSFSITAPSDPRLPGGGGQVISGLYDITPTLFGLVNNFSTWGSNFGEEYSRYNGVLLNVSARTRNGITFQGGHQQREDRDRYLRRPGSPPRAHADSTRTVTSTPGLSRA